MTVVSVVVVLCFVIGVLAPFTGLTGRRRVDLGVGLALVLGSTATFAVLSVTCRAGCEL